MIRYFYSILRNRNSSFITKEQTEKPVLSNFRQFYKFILTCGSFIFLSLNFLSAQQSILDKTISLKEQTNTIGGILNQIAAAGGCSFAYGNFFSLDKEVHIDAEVESVGYFLHKIFSDIPVQLKETKNKVLIFPILCQSLRGTVVDEETRRPLAGAHIYIEDNGNLLATTSGFDGHFLLGNIPLGRHDIRVSFIGFEEEIIPDVVFGSTKEVVEVVSLAEKPFLVDEVFVKPDYRRCEPKNEMAMVSARSFSVEETKRYPAAINDPSRMALVFTGTAIDEDATNEIVIRGNSPNGLLWRLEGIEIPAPNHFAIAESSSGYVSILSANLIDRSDFFTGAFPAEYGNAQSGIFDISLRNGNNQNREYSFQVGFIGTDLAAEGPFSKNYSGSYLINFRYSTFDLLTKAGVRIAGKELFPKFGDLSFKLNLPTKKYGIFSIWGVGGSGETIDEADSTSTKKSERKEDRYFSTVAATGITHFFQPDSNSYLKSVVSCSINNTIDKGLRYDSLNQLNLYDHEDLAQTSLRASLLYKYKFSPKFSLKLGGIFSHMIYDFFDIDYETNVVDHDSQGNTQLFQAYIQTKHKLSQRFDLTGGVHFLYFSLNEDWSLEPRLGFMWRLTEKQSLGFGLGKHTRHEILPAYFVQVMQPDSSYSIPNKKMDLTKSVHAVLSYERDIGRNMYVKTELYYQYFYDIPVRNISPFIMAPFNNSFEPDSLFSKGSARNYGIEITLERKFYNGYYFMSATSLFDSKIDPGNDTLYHTKFNRQFVQNLVGGKEFTLGKKEQDLFGINAKLIWAGGNRGRIDPKTGDPIEDRQNRYGIQYADYFRIDMSIIYRINKLRASHILSIDVQNITNRINPVTTKTNHTGIVPFFNYKIEF